MVERALPGGGEREMTMGITYAISPAALPSDLDYVALGHVHRPQSVPGLAAPGRYAGSPMALDFSEDNHAKSAVIVEVRGDTTTARLAPLTAARPLVRLRGGIDELAALASAHPGAWFACDVELDAPEMDLVPRVRAAVPDALRVEPHYAPAPDVPAAAAGGDEDGLAGLGDLYAAWYRLQDRRLPEAQAEAFARGPGRGRLRPGALTCARSRSPSRRSARTTPRRSTCATTTSWSSRATPGRARPRCSTRWRSPSSAAPPSRAGWPSSSPWATPTERCG